MAQPTLTPGSQTSKVILPTGSSPSDAAGAEFPFNVYTDDQFFLSGAADQVAYTFHKLGGDVLDIELTKEQIFSSYQESVLEYSYLINVHQATNVLSDALGNTTGSFDSDGNLMDGPLKTSLSGDHVSLKYPKFDYSMTRRVAQGIGSEVGLQGSVQYSASFDAEAGKQDYNLQEIIESNLLDLFLLIKL